MSNDVKELGFDSLQGVDSIEAEIIGSPIQICARISPLYQYIRAFSDNRVPLSTPGANMFRPLFTEVLAHFTKLMETYVAFT